MARYMKKHGVVYEVWIEEVRHGYKHRVRLGKPEYATLKEARGIERKFKGRYPVTVVRVTRDVV